jgi:hypothetical protein
MSFVNCAYDFEEITLQEVIVTKNSVTVVG